jgi:hypothetical protein
MILLITSSPRGSELRQALQEGIGGAVDLVRNTTTGVRLLRERDFEAIVLDQSAILDGNAFLQHAGSAVPVHINSALSSSSRIVREVKNALQRRRADRTAAVNAAAKELREDLRNAVTGILITSELALSDSHVHGGLQAKLRKVVQLAEGMKRTLQI